MTLTDSDTSDNTDTAPVKNCWFNEVQLENISSSKNSEHHYFKLALWFSGIWHILSPSPSVQIWVGLFAWNTLCALYSR